MTLRAFFNPALVAASIVGVIVAIGAWLDSYDTKNMIREVHPETECTLAGMKERSKMVLSAIDARDHDQQE